MNDLELADAVVALGVGRQGKYPESADGAGFYYTPTDENTHEEEGLYSKLFVRDWRVAGALMEKIAKNCVDNKRVLGMTFTADKNSMYVSADTIGGSDIDITNESLPRAIIEACVTALTEL